MLSRSIQQFSHGYLESRQKLRLLGSQSHWTGFLHFHMVRFHIEVKSSVGIVHSYCDQRIPKPQVCFCPYVPGRFAQRRHVGIAARKWTDTLYSLVKFPEVLRQVPQLVTTVYFKNQVSWET